MNTLRRFCSVFPNKPPIFGHIFKVSFDRKCAKVIDILIFIIENKSNCVHRFFIKPLKENKVKMSICVNFRIKVTKKWFAKKAIG